MGTAQRKLDHLEQAKRLLLKTVTGLTPTQLAEALGVDRSTAHRYLAELSVQNNNGVYFYEPTDADREFAALVLRRTKRRSAARSKPHE